MDVGPGERRDAIEIFADAIDCAPHALGAFLARECGGDAALRAEVESLLAARGPARALFDSGVLLGTLAESIGEIPDALIGSQAGAYRITRAIAAGGMGAVYLGVRTDDVFEKAVAIKVVRPGPGGRDLLERFRIERQVLADLEHPGIARLIDGGVTANGLPFLVMEYVDGAPIDRYCAENALAIGDRLRLFLDVCEAVSDAHKHLVIHRDVKPSNILVDREGRPRLLDFGIAKVLGSTRVGDGHDATVTALRALTPRYASPEQLRGGRMTTSTDIYSLGVVLFEMLTGVLPYRLADRSPSEIEQIICEAPITRPSRAAKPALARRLSGDLDTILLKALAKEPERRYATVDEFAQDLRRHLAGLPVQARPDTATYRVSKFVQRNRALVGSIAAVIVILASAFVVTFREYRRATARTREAQWFAYVNSLGAAESSILRNKVSEAERYLEGSPIELRGWEWRHLLARLDRSLRSCRAHAAGVTRVAQSADGRFFATSSTDSTVKLWDAESWQCLRTWGPLSSGVESAAVDPKGRFVIAGANDGEVRLLSIDAGANDVILNRGVGWAFVTVNADGSRAAAGFFDGRVTVWDVTSHAVIQEWQAHSGIAIAAYSPLGTRLVTAGADGLVRSWDARTHTFLQQIHAHPRRVSAFAVSADELRIVTGSIDRTATVWDLTSNAPVSTFRDHGATIGGLAFDATGERVVSSSADGQLLVWNASSAERLAELHGHTADVYHLDADPRQSTILTGDWSGWIKAWDWEATDVRTLRPANNPWLVVQPRDVAMDHIGVHLACATNDASFIVWDLASGGAPRRIDVGVSTRVAFEPIDHGWVVGTESGVLKLVDLNAAAIQDSVRVGRGPVLALDVDPAGRWIAVSCGDSLLTLRSREGLALVRECAGHCGAVLDVAFSPSGDAFASGGADGDIRIWEAATGRLQSLLRGHSASVTDVCWSPDGRALASASKDGSVMFWDMEHRRNPVTLIERPSAMSAVAFNSDGTRLAAGGVDEIVWLVDVRSRREVVSLHGHVSRISALVFAPEDRYLISAARDGTVRLWDAAPERTAGAP